jgi:hypothetical protein
VITINFTYNCKGRSRLHPGVSVLKRFSSSSMTVVQNKLKSLSKTRV